MAREVVGALAPLARQPAAGQRAPRDHRHAVALARRQHVGLDAAHEDGIRRLLAHEPLAAATVGDPLRLDDRGSRERGAPQVADLALVHEVRQRAQRVVDVGPRVGTVDLVQVDVVRVEAPEALLALADDPPAGVAAHVRVGAHVAVHLRREHDVVAPSLKCLGDDRFGLPGRVHVGGVDEVDAGIERRVDHVDRLVVVGIAPRAEHHRPETEWAHRHAGTPERTLFHESLLRYALVETLRARGEGTGTVESRGQAGQPIESALRGADLVARRACAVLLRERVRAPGTHPARTAGSRRVAARPAGSSPRSGCPASTSRRRWPRGTWPRPRSRGRARASRGRAHP